MKKLVFGLMALAFAACGRVDVTGTWMIGSEDSVFYTYRFDGFKAWINEYGESPYTAVYKQKRNKITLYNFLEENTLKQEGDILWIMDEVDTIKLRKVSEFSRQQGRYHAQRLTGALPAVAGAAALEPGFGLKTCYIGYAKPAFRTALPNGALVAFNDEILDSTALENLLRSGTHPVFYADSSLTVTEYPLSLIFSIGSGNLRFAAEGGDTAIPYVSYIDIPCAGFVEAPAADSRLMMLPGDGTAQLHDTVFPVSEIADRLIGSEGGKVQVIFTGSVGIGELLRVFAGLEKWKKRSKEQAAFPGYELVTGRILER